MTEQLTLPKMRRRKPCAYCGGEGAIRYITRRVEDRPIYAANLYRNHPADSIINEAVEIKCSMCGGSGRADYAPEEIGGEDG